MPEATTITRRRTSLGGRPKLPPSQRRTYEFRAFMNAAERAKFEHDAAMCGLCPQDYFRQLAAGHKPQQRVELTADPRLLLSLNRIGVLLNQIARYFHTDNPRRKRLDSVMDIVETTLRDITRPKTQQDEDVYRD